jgi:two-component system KDP operon response regulator KdpE
MPGRSRTNVSPPPGVSSAVNVPPIASVRPRATRSGDEVRLTPTEWHIVEVLARRQGRLVRQAELLHEVWGPGYDRETNYLRVYLAQIRRKLETNPSRPTMFITDPGIGYRLVTPA